MFCPKCGTKLPEQAKFCAACGCNITQDAAQQVQQQPTPEKTHQPASALATDGFPPILPNAKMVSVPPAFIRVLERPPITKKKRKVIIAVAVLLVVAVALSVLIPTIVHNAKQEKYLQAQTLFLTGQYEQALVLYREAGNFSDAAMRVIECQNNIDYLYAKALFDDGSYERAKDAFAALGAFSDAAEQAALCQNTIDYLAAQALYENGDYLAAATAFAALSDFSDAGERALESESEYYYLTAVSYMNDDQLEEAVETFDCITAADYKDAATLRQGCCNEIDYRAADAAYCGGLYYTAYVGFSALGDYCDAASRATDCLRPVPKSGELYRNADYEKKSIQLIIKLTNPDIMTCIHIYRDDTKKLASTVFFDGTKSKLTIYLPAGDYYFDTAVGTEWFGEQELFGKSGYYSDLRFEDDTLTTTLQNGYYTTVTW